MLQEGDEFAGYRIVRPLGRGGMGVVYVATQSSLDRPIALKILAPECAADETFRERFRREARAQARIDHPNIVSIIETGEFDGQLFIAMQFIDGPAVKQLIHDAQLDDELTLRVLGPIALALDEAHKTGLVHRDVTPGNILVGPRDHPYLADFGLTKCADQGTGLTSTGDFIGTVAYCSPEQIHRRVPTTPLSDIYSLAAVLYHCLTGEVTFPASPGDLEITTMFAVVDNAPPCVTDRRPDLPAALDRVVLRALAKDPSERHQTAGELMRAVQRALAKPDRQPVRSRELLRVTHDAAVRGVAFTPDGACLGSCSDDGSARVTQIETRRVVQRLSHRAGRRRPPKLFDVAFSRGGDRIATAGRDGAAWVWALGDGAEYLHIPHRNWVRSVAFSPDGELVATACDDRTARLWNVPQRSELPSITGTGALKAVAFSPDSTRLATAADDRSACVWDLVEDRELRCVPHDGVVWDVAFSPDGRYLATASEDHAARVWDLGEDRPPLTLPHASAVWAVSFSPDGSQIATAGDDVLARVWDLDGCDEVLALAHDGVVWDVSFSPRGGQLATASDDHMARVWTV